MASLSLPFTLLRTLPPISSHSLSISPIFKLGLICVVIHHHSVASLAKFSSSCTQQQQLLAFFVRVTDAMALTINNISATFRFLSSSSSSSSFPITIASPLSIPKSSSSFQIFSLNKRQPCQCIIAPQLDDEEEPPSSDETTLLYSFSPLPLLLLGALPGAGTIRSLFGPFVEIVKSLNLPEWLVHWGHPGNMAVVLFAMGGYGTYLGFRIKFSDDVEEKAKAKDLHPKLLAGMFFFFALGATGGVTSLLTSDKPILESPHAVTGLIGLTLLTIQTILPSLFEGKPELRNVHGILGSGIMTLFLVHAALGLQLGLSS